MFRLSVIMCAFAAFTLPAFAEVRFGNNVRIGGNDVSNQTFTKQKRGKFIIHEKAPKNAGCAWRKNSDGSRTKVCNFQRKKTKESR
ncbi:hypothetical protein [uncultured Sulfitobacter sp.]|uniref:hypothetical protein n=1 Tax=uncultured Sulfitobacter sp. TaxID=191468 RepID=UPI00260C07E9|nr:hypothetical protein [uncultured Sulfitobacter sp.]